MRCAKPGGAGFYDHGNRDAKQVTCHATGCLYNIAAECAAPSRCKIQADGRCAGFQAKPLPKERSGD